MILFEPVLASRAALKRRIDLTFHVLRHDLAKRAQEVSWTLQAQKMAPIKNRPHISTYRTIRCVDDGFTPSRPLRSPGTTPRIMPFTSIVPKRRATSYESGQDVCPSCLLPRFTEVLTSPARGGSVALFDREGSIFLTTAVCLPLLLTTIVKNSLISI